MIQSRYWTCQSREVGASSTYIAPASSAEVVPKSMSMGSDGSLNSAEGLVMSRAKIFGGTVVRPEAIVTSQSSKMLSKN